MLALGGAGSVNLPTGIGKLVWGGGDTAARRPSGRPGKIRLRKGARHPTASWWDRRSQTRASPLQLQEIRMSLLDQPSLLDPGRTRRHSQCRSLPGATLDLVLLRVCGPNQATLDLGELQPSVPCPPDLQELDRNTDVDRYRAQARKQCTLNGEGAGLRQQNT